MEPSYAVKRRNGYQTGGRRPARSAGLRPQLELWLGLRFFSPTVFRSVAPCNSVSTCQSFGRTYCLRLQVRRMMETVAACFSKMLVKYELHSRTYKDCVFTNKTLRISQFLESIFLKSDPQHVSALSKGKERHGRLSLCMSYRHMANGGVIPLILNIGTSWRRAVSFMPRLLYLQLNTPDTTRTGGWSPKAGQDALQTRHVISQWRN